MFNIELHSTQNKEELMAEIYRVHSEIESYIRSIDPEDFFSHKFGGWSVAENVNHITFTTNILSLSLYLPTFFFLLFIGRNESRKSKSHLDLKIEYEKMLTTPQNAGIYAPWRERKPKNAGKKLNSMLKDWIQSGKNLSDNLSSWKEEDIDYALIPHPVMGIVTIREMIQLSLLHTIHHIKKVHDKINFTA